MAKIGFNLLRPQLSNEDTWDKIYKWISTTARIIVIFTELVVVVVFVIRIIVDRRARDLTEILQENHARLEALAPAEAEIRVAQDDTFKYSEIWNQSTEFGSIIDEIYSYDKLLAPYLSVRITETGLVEVTGTINKGQVEDLENVMKSSDSFVSVQLVNYRPGANEDFRIGRFQIEAKLKEVARTPLSEIYSAI